MSNDDVYAAGLLNRALDPATQPPEIQAFLRAELDLLRDVIKEGMRVLDVGCGTGRHLVLLRDRLRLGVGVDYERSYIAEAARRARAGHLHFITGDASEHFSDARLRSLVGDCTIRPVADIARVVTF